MLTWLKNLLFDETMFVGLARAALLALGSAEATGQLDAIIDAPPWVGVVLMAFAGFIRSSSSQVNKGSRPNN